MGLKININNPAIVNAIVQVLRRIDADAPADYSRLKSIVREFSPLDDKDEETLGIWEPDDKYGWDYFPGECEGVIKLRTDYPVEHLEALVAHELGHAATTMNDLDRRGDLPTEEWRSELSGDWYAYKWGFGRAIARTRKTRPSLHHGPTPGQIWHEYCDGKCFKYKLTRNFVSHLIDQWECRREEFENIFL